MLHIRAVYDARLAGIPITLIGEKPIATRSDHLETVSQYTAAGDFLFCNFIDIGNDAFRALREYVVANKLPIDRIACWRANSSGIRKSLGDGRVGVVGGALLDKAAHDVALVSSLLNSQEAAVDAAEIHHIVPQAGNQWFTVGDELEGSDDPARWLPVDTSWPADGTASAEARWFSTHAVVPVSFVWGWHGVTGIAPESIFERALHDIGHDRPYRLRHVVDLVEEQKRYRTVNPGLFGDKHMFVDEDVRLLLVWSGEHIIVCNLLGKDYGTPEARLERYVLDYVGNDCKTVFEPPAGRDLKQINRDDLANIFTMVVRAHMGGDIASDLAQERTEAVHRFVFEAQKTALRDLALGQGHFADVRQQSVDLVRSKLQSSAPRN